MENFTSTHTFCKSIKKILKEAIYIMVAYFFITNIRYLFIDATEYFEHVFTDFFYALFSFLITLILEFFITDCVDYDENYFWIRRSTQAEENSKYSFDDIVKINYMPYIRILTIKFKGENSFIDISPYNYKFQEFEPFLEKLERYQPITRKFEFLNNGLKKGEGKIVLFFLVSVILILIVLGVFFG